MERRKIRIEIPDSLRALFVSAAGAFGPARAATSVPVLALTCIPPCAIVGHHRGKVAGKSQARSGAGAGAGCHGRTRKSDGRD